MGRSKLGALLLACVALSAAGCKRSAAEEKARPTQEVAASAVPHVHFTKLVERKLPPTLETSGTLDADETSEVAASVGGVVTKVAVDVGARVKKGDILVQLDPRDPALRVSAANAQAGQALAKLGIKPGEKFDPEKVPEVVAAKQAMDLAVTDAERTKSLFDNGSISAAQWDQTRTRAEQAKAQYDAAVNGARQAWAALLGAQSQSGLAQKAVADTSIRAPFDGGIAERRISEGEYAQPGRVVVVVVRDRPLRLRIDVPEVDAAKVTVGSEVTLTVAAFPGRVFKGVIKRVAASLKTQSRSLPVEAEIPNDDGVLKPGFFAHAAIDLGGDDVTALLVPRSAVGTSGSASRVFVRSGNRVVERIVAIGREIDGLVEVRGALQPTDEIATDSLDALSDGAEIQLAQ